MKMCSGLLLLSCLALSLPVCAQASLLSERTLVRMAPMGVAPVADGRISKEEMRGAFSSYGAISGETGLMAVRYAVFYFGYTEKGFYFAVRSATPPSPQKLTETDRAVLTLLPPGASTPVEVELPLSKGRRLKGVVDFGVECAESERFVAFGELGAAKPFDGRPWGLQMRIDFSSKAETAWWHYDKAGSLGTFIPDPSAPIVSQTHFSPLESWRAGGTYDWEFRVKNPTSSPAAIASLTKLMRGVGYSKLDSGAVVGTAEKCLDVRFGGTVGPGEEKAFYHRETAMWPGTVNTLDIDVRSPGSDVPFYRRTISWDVEKGLRWKDEIGLPSLDSAFYPSKGNRFRARFRANGVKDLVKGGVIVVGPGGRRFFEKRYVGSPYLRDESIDTQLGDLPLGDYVVKFAAIDSKGAKYTDEKTFSSRSSRGRV